MVYFIKLAILISGCPGDMYITNFTRKPHQHGSFVFSFYFALII